MFVLYLMHVWGNVLGVLRKTLAIDTAWKSLTQFKVVLDISHQSFERKGLKMGKNVGSVDRMIRIVIGVALIAGYFFNGDGAYSWLYLVGGALALATAAMSFCGLYRLIGVNTCKR